MPRTPLDPRLKTITEAQLQNAVIDLALHLGWKVSWSPDWMKTLAIASMRQQRRNDRRWPPAGLPDLLLARNGRVIIAELKSHTGRLKPEQHAWLTELALHPTLEIHLWRPADWLSGAIETILA